MATVRDQIVVVAFLAIAALPMGAKLAHVRDLRVDGAVARTPRPTLTVAGFRDESYQTAYKTWFEGAFGLKGYAIRLDNTVLFHGLRDVKPGSAVRIGERDVLFIDEDVWYYNRDTVPFDQGELDRFAGRIAALQTKLQARHRAFVPVIIPSKTTIYRDAIPERWTRDLGDPRPSDAMLYREMKRALDAHHIAYVDARQLLATSTTPREILWGASARHWSTYGACLALQQVAQRYGELTGNALSYDCPVHLGPAPTGDADYDLVRLLNAWGVSREPLVPRVDHAQAATSGAPSVMFVGTSFCWTFLRDAVASHRFASAHLDYYNKTLVDGGTNSSAPVMPHTPGWRAAFLDQDLYVLDLFESYYGAPDSYLDHFLEELATELP